MTSASDRRSLRLAAAGLLLLEIPFALLAPAEADRAVRDDDLAGGLVIGHRLPFGIVGLAERSGEIRGAQEALGHEPFPGFHQPHQKWHIRILARVIAEIFGLTIDVEFLQDHVAHGHRQRGVGALLRRHPEIGELRGFGIVRADHDALGALVADLGIEMRVGRAGLRDVRAPQDEKAGIVPVGAFRHVGLLAPGLRRGRRQVAVPVVERHADAAEQRQIARAGRVADHRHRRDRREAEHAVRAVGLGGVGVGGGDDLVDLVPAGANETAEAALLHVGCALLRILDDRLPGRDRRHQHAAPRATASRAASGPADISRGCRNRGTSYSSRRARSRAARGWAGPGACADSRSAGFPR